VPAIPFDILIRHRDGSLLWVEAASNIQLAQSRLQQLCTAAPGDYFVFDQARQQIVARSSDFSRTDV
jgi:hypothetical protein